MAIRSTTNQMRIPGRLQGLAGVRLLAVHLCTIFCLLVAQTDFSHAQVRKVGPEFQVNTAFVGTQLRPNVAIAAGGKFVIVWGGIFEDHHQDGFGIWGRTFRRGGQPATGQFLVTDTEEFDEWSEGDATIDCASDERCTVAWTADLQTNGELSIVAAKTLDLSTQETEPTLPVSTRSDVSHQRAGVARSDSGRSMVVWHDAGMVLELPPNIVMGRVVTKEGTALTPPFELASTTIDPRLPQVIALKDGSFVATWWGRDTSGDFNVYARRFDAEGHPVAEEFRVNESVQGGQQRPAIAPADDNGFLAVWEDGSRNDDQSLGIYARRFGPNDAPIGPQYHVNTYTLDSQVQPAVENDGVGGFVVAWVSFSDFTGPGQDGDGLGVFGRRLHDDGSPDGLEFQINTTTDFAQGWITWPIGLAARNGRVVATWQDERLGRYVFDIFAQRFTLTLGAGPVCGDAHAQDLRLDLRDALQILRGATGLRPCLACLCDADGSGSVAAGDALVVLRTAVGIGVTSQCPACQEGDESPAGAFGFGFPESDD